MTNPAHYVGDQCGYLAAIAQDLIDTGQAKSLTPDQKEAWLVENTSDAANIFDIRLPF